MPRVQSIERAFAVLGALADGPVGVTEVSERVRLPKSTVARLLGSLAREGAVEQVPGDARYRLGGRLVSLAASIDSAPSLISVARPYLVALASETGEAAGLAVPDGRDAQYIDQVDTTHQVRVRDWTGTRAPMHAVPSGLVMLAAMPDTSLDALLEGPLQRFTPRTVIDRARLRERLDRVRADGYAWVHEEFAEGLNSVAAPVRDATGAAAAAVHVHGPAYRFPGHRNRADIERAVVEAAARITSRLHA
jgi:DNA-binding IclR family transcriptional regulator